MFESIKKALSGKSHPESTIVPILYTKENDGTFVEQMDIMYPDGTVFYVKSHDGEFVPESPAAPEYDLLQGQEVLDLSQMGKERIIDTAVKFLRQNGYTVEMTSEIIGSDTQIEAAILLDKLRSMVSSHMSNREHIEQACALIDELKAAR